MLADFMGDLHWHLDAVMLLTYVLEIPDEDEAFAEGPGDDGHHSLR